jgi:hypothetical protein
MSLSTDRNHPNPTPACVICDCFEVADTVPDLTGRKARCAYFGQGGFRNYEYLSRIKGKCSREKCECEVPSSYDLPFFKLAELSYKKDKEYDRFFCGCSGWD